MQKLLGLVRKSLALKILVALTVGAAIVMGVVIYLSVTSQREQFRERMTTFGSEMKSLAYAGIKHPMAVGDSASIEKQLFDIKDELQGTEIVICDFNQRIVFATHAHRIGTAMSDFTANQETLTALQNLLATGTPPDRSSFEEEENGKKYLVTMHSIRNEEECHHCHGTSRQILGGLLTRQSTDTTYAAIASLRNRTVAISVVGIGALIAVIYYLLARLVTRPVTTLAATSEKLARGNLSVSVPVASADAIGVLGSSFNAMVRSIQDQIEFANSLKVAIADPLFMVDRNMVISFMNEACAQLTGYSKQETEGLLTCREIFKSDICDTNCPLKRCLATGAPVEGIRTTITDRTGRPVPIMTSASALKDAHGSIIGAVEICKDISVVLEAERLRYIQKAADREEEQRKELEARAEQLLSTLAQVSAGDLQVRAEVTKKNEVMDKIAQHTNHMLENIEKLYEKISSFSKELELEVARRTMMLQEKTLLLERANRELRELDRLKSSFLANMSHELRTPMNSIIGYTDLLLDRVDGEINEEQEKSLLKVGNNAKHLLQLINDILDMSKIEAGKVELDLRETDLRQLIESAVTTFDPAVKLKNLFVRYDFADNLPPVYVDNDKARQILNNLLSNATKFTNKGGITLRARPSTQGIKPGNPPLFVEVCVEDTGIGIKKEDMDKLFDKFSQIDVSTIRQYEGTGLGLSIARGLVVLHKGVIWAESEFGRGTKLCFTLPADKKILEKPAEPMIEPIMADKLADYFNKPAETFLSEPSYGGKPIRCWEYMHCGQTSCPAYGSKEHRCWLISGTHCKGIAVAKCPEKAEFCKGCEIIEKLILEQNGGLEAAVDEPPADQEINQCRKTILVIDDNPDVIELIKKNIGNEYNVIGQLQGEGAVQKAMETKPAAITLDIMMPHKNGWQVLQELKNTPETRDIPVIILSIVDEKKMGFGLGAAEYLVKPVEKNILLRKLKNLEKITSIRKILIIDQDRDTASMLVRDLAGEGYDVDSAYSTKQAVDRILQAAPDLIIMNLMMPAADGIDLIEYIKTEEPVRDTPLILLTNKELSEEEVLELNGRIQATLNKGLLTEEDLIRELKNTIKRLQ